MMMKSVATISWWRTGGVAFLIATCVTRHVFAFKVGQDNRNILFLRHGRTRLYPSYHVIHPAKQHRCWNANRQCAALSIRKALILPSLLPHQSDDKKDEGMLYADADGAIAIDSTRPRLSFLQEGALDASFWVQQGPSSSLIRDYITHQRQPKDSAGCLMAATRTAVGELAIPTVPKPALSQMFPLVINPSLAQPSWCYGSTAYALTQAGLIGSITGLFVVLFKLAIEAVRSLCYEQDFLAGHHTLIPLIPALGGAVVGVLLLFGGPFAPGLKGTVEEVDRTTLALDNYDKHSGDSLWEHIKIQANILRKSFAAIATLGTGCSLGPEGPCVEIGLSIARICTQLNKPNLPQSKHTASLMALQPGTNPQELLERGWNRILLSCGGAAGVAAGFNAPIAGVFFALEIMQKAFTAIDDKLHPNSHNKNAAASTMASTNLRSLFCLTSPTTITPILIASVLSALISQTLLGDHLVLTMTHFDLETPLIELPLYILLGGLSGIVAFAFTHSSEISQRFFSGDYGPNSVRRAISTIPDAAKPMIGGLLCGLVGLCFPQILFFGYSTLNSLLKNNSLSVTMALTLLVTKT